MADVTHILSQNESCDSPSPSCFTSLSRLRSGVWSKSNFLSLFADEKEPALTVNELASQGPSGSVGVWAFPTSGTGHFRNLKVTSAVP